MADGIKETNAQQIESINDGNTNIENKETSLETNSNEQPFYLQQQAQHGGSQPKIIREVYLIRTEPTVLDYLQFSLTFLIYAIIIQSLCVVVKKINRRVYENIVRIMLVVFPPFVFLFAKSLLFPLVWAAFFSFMIYKYLKINKKPIGKNVPRETYELFKRLFIATNLGIGLFQSLLFLSFFFFAEKLAIIFLCFIFFLYFGLLSREIILFFSETMATNTGFYSKEGVPGRSNNDSICMICTKTFDNTETIHTLVCGHSFHECCIKGWCMIAKKGFCPYCKKGVDMNTIPSEVWYRTEVWFYPMINMLRNFIIFALFMSVIIMYKFYNSVH